MRLPIGSVRKAIGDTCIPRLAKLTGVNNGLVPGRGPVAFEFNQWSFDAQLTQRQEWVAVASLWLRAANTALATGYP